MPHYSNTDAANVCWSAVSGLYPGSSSLSNADSTLTFAHMGELVQIHSSFR